MRIQTLTPSGIPIYPGQSWINGYGTEFIVFSVGRRGPDGEVVLLNTITKQRVAQKLETFNGKSDGLSLKPFTPTEEPV